MDDHDHDRGLFHDLQTIGENLMGRRRALAILASAGGFTSRSTCGTVMRQVATRSIPAASPLRATCAACRSPMPRGKGTFNTIYPACYSGRWPHIHFEIFTGGLTSASTGRTASLVSQLAMPAASDTAVFTGDSRYTASIANYNAISLSSDNVFGDNSSAQVAQMTPTLSGSATAGYTGTALIGIAA